MNVIKEQSKRIIDNMPEDVSYDEILKALAFDKMIKNGIQDKTLFPMKKCSKKLSSGRN